MKKAFRGVLVLMLSLLAAVVQAADRPKVALVLSGGGARGLAHVGVFKELERQRVAYDCIVGTSMGAIAGGAMATGLTVEEAEQKVIAADWDSIFADRAKRTDIPYFRKEDDWKDYFDFSMPFKDMKLYTARNFIGVQNIGLFFRELTNAQYSSNFDELPIPYRAIGTDIVTGEQVVIHDGTVATAMRASMSIPGVFPPIEYEGHLLVDGGISNNIPVDVGRELCGDVVIVVNVATPTLNEEQLTSFFNIGMQVISIAMQRNMDEQLRNIRPHDILIVPDLGEYTSVDFKQARELIDMGEASVRRVEGALKQYALPEEEYAAWKAGIAAKRMPPPIIRHVSVEKTRWVNPGVMERLLDIHTGKPFDMQALHHNIAGVYSRGDFTSISYDLEPSKDDEGADVILKPQEKPARDFVRLGLRLESDFDTSSNFGVLAALRRVWLNRLDAEWTTEVEIGDNVHVVSEWYQPLALEGEFFVAPRAYYGKEPREVVVADRAVAEYEVKKYGAGFEMGSTIGRWGQVRLGVEQGHAGMNHTKGIGLGNLGEERSGYTLRGVYDQIDNPRFPYQGSAVHVNGFFSSKNLGSESDWKRVEIDGRTAFTYGKNSVLLAGRLGYSVDTDLPPYELFYLGGLFNLSAYRQWSLYENNLVYGRVQFFRQISTLPSLIGKGVYAGGMLEGGNVLSNEQVRELELGDVKYSGGLYLAADTRLGPFYLAANRGSGGKNAFYLAIGAQF